ncbi:MULTISPECIES: glutamate--cysteine ligase [Hydrocarboniphaga]|jgi:glutamate--cysteine ligase|uniref:Glutamate/cysteine ligase n=1 Tax=Hydrocarboniphaga effusa AP103 TaxID=1172194 RepID=I8T4M0_9GAMM|nr:MULTISPECIES: glutamate--cysteine ligase [Hydrocarboniphaga]EIT68668.1 glutamate/cysteine ligase [Hydrocarboniphaga effusa AP103]MDZ4076813.1 glutamate--cysteine ligase [Hydrocarboniphaga sp.]
MTGTAPSLSTGNTAPLLRFETQLLQRSADIEAWFRSQWHKTAPPFYCSVDLRNAGFKLAPVDTNLFPGGFNNLNPEFESLCVQAIQSAVERVCPDAKSLLLVPENHTRNKFYLENVATLFDLIQKAGFHVRIGSVIPDLREPTDLTLEISGRTLHLEPLQRTGNRVHLADFDPCVVLLNNDLSAGIPPILDGVEQQVLPPQALGWHARLKSHHFGFYREVARDFGEVAGIDSWLVDPLFRNCGQINFLKREGEECLVSNVELLLEDIKAKYKQYDIKEEPFVIVKADAGTYGMGVMTVKSVDDVREMNRKARTHMASAKEGRDVTGAIIQEGVYTFETWGPEHHTAEPVVYMIDRFVVGGFYRVNEKRGNQENLNSPGMSFKPLAFESCCSHPDRTLAPDALPNRSYAYGIVARLALLAAAREVAASRMLAKAA